ncbi:MAG: hypothetical protein P8Y25_16080, partial [Chromatiaceae bacterium]
NQTCKKKYSSDQVVENYVFALINDETPSLPLFARILIRPEEQRAALAEAKERALTLALERRELAQEGRRLRAQQRERTERLEAAESSGGNAPQAADG